MVECDTAGFQRCCFIWRPPIRKEHLWTCLDQVATANSFAPAPRPSSSSSTAALQGPELDNGSDKKANPLSCGLTRLENRRHSTAKVG